MQIDSLQTGGFGALSGEYEFSAGLNIVTAANEQGKTTLAAALLCLLYGIKTDSGRRRMASEQEHRYRPFSGGDFNLGGMVRLRSGRQLNIWRDFHSDSCRVLDMDSSRDISNDFQRAPSGDVLGQKLLELTRSQYEKLACVRHDEFNPDLDFAEFSDTLSTMLSTDEGESSSVHNALAALDSALLKYPGVTGKGAIKIDTELSRLQSRLSEVEDELDTLERDYARSEEDFAEVADNLLCNEQLQRDIHKYEYLAMCIRADDLQKQIEQSRNAAKLLEEYNQRLVELSAFESLELDGLEELTGLRQLHADRKKKLEHLTKELNVEEAALGLLNQKQEQQQGLEHVHEEDLHEMELAARQYKELQQREGSANIDAQSASTALRANGGNPDQARLLLDFLQKLEDGEREFISSYPQTFSRINKRLAALSEKRDEISKESAELDQRREAARSSALKHFIFAVVMMGVAIAAFFALGAQWFMAAPAVLCLCWGIYGAVRMGQSGNSESEALAQLRGNLQLLQTDEDSLDEERVTLHEKLQTLAGDFPGGLAALDGALQQPAEALESLNSFLQINQRLHNLLVDIEASRENLEPKLREWGLWRGQGRPSADNVVNCLRQAREHMALKQQCVNKEENVQKLSVQIAAVDQEISNLQERARKILQQAGINTAELPDLFAGIEKYRSLIAQHSEYVRLREELVPAAQAGCVNEQALGRLEEDLRITRARTKQAREASPFLEALTPEKSLADYEELTAATRRKLGDDSQAIADRERQMTLEEERYKAKVPGLLEEKATLQKALEKAQRYQSAVKLAGGCLEKIAAELHSRWSPLLAGELNTSIAGFSGKWQFSLSKDLKLGVVPLEGGVGLDSEGLWRHLSSGTRDQVYLCLRLLLAGKLDHKEPLPLILDDPFVNADDERFVQGMKMLQEIAREHQVFVFSCHTHRHKMLAEISEDFASAMCM